MRGGAYRQLVCVGEEDPLHRADFEELLVEGPGELDREARHMLPLEEARLPEGLEVRLQDVVELLQFIEDLLLTHRHESSVPSSDPSVTPFGLVLGVINRSRCYRR